MSLAGEVDAPAVEKATEELEPKPVKENKPKQAKPASHPPYFQMIKEALLALKEKSGSSPYAIAKSMEEKHKSVLPDNFRKILGVQLKNQAARGKLVKIKASYKLSEASKKGQKESTSRLTRATAEKQQRPKRTRAAAAAAAAPKSKKVVKGGKKKVGVRKTNKVSTPAKPKQPKSIRSPAKRARKASATA